MKDQSTQVNSPKLFEEEAMFVYATYFFGLLIGFSGFALMVKAIFKL